MKQREQLSHRTEPVYDVVSPLGRSVTEPLPFNAPLDGLNGKTVGELWDFLFKGDKMFPVIREQLRQRYPGVKFVEYQALGNTHGSDEAEVIARLPSLLREHGCDAVISAVGA